MSIPTECPHTFQDLLDAKKFTNEKLDRNYKNLVKFDAVKNELKRCGNDILYNYQFQNLLNCRREGQELIEEIWSDPEKLDILWKQAIKRKRNPKAVYPSAVDMFEGMRINKGAIVFFKSSTAKYLYKKYGATSVLDFTAGWGGRLLGATSLGIKYTGIDTNTKMKQGYEDMIDYFKFDKSKITMMWESCLEVDYSKIDYDFILTSPPYINMELYENMDPFESEAYFYEYFLKATMIKSFHHLKDGGRMAINISEKMYKKLTKEFEYPECDEFEDLKQSIGKKGKSAMDYIYIWVKGGVKKLEVIEADEC
jgi:tRNA1(Val) A37 N6-methylase TrmN6